MMTKKIQQTIRCSLAMTNNARDGIRKWLANEQTFFALESAFDVHVEKQPLNRQGNHSYAFYFDPETNPRLGKKLDARVAVMQCVLKSDGLLATGFHVRGTRESVKTNRRYQGLFDFQLNRPGLPLAADIHMTLQGLPVAEERSEYVKKQIESWEGYLQIAESQADVEDIHCTFSTYSFSGDFTKVRLHCNGLKAKNWRQLQGFSVKLESPSVDLGQVVNANKGKQIVEVELKRPLQKAARETNKLPAPNGKITLSNFASLTQIRRLRKGFKDLEDGLAANANLEKILFAERPLVKINNKKFDLDFHNNLNEFQREAVTGAMKANDLYVIQGPPGTGKTTVISEICYQNVKAGLRTLVASQSNLAVDNALGRLLSDPAIRILRYGRTESIEEEGRKFIEENVALHWRDGTLENVRQDLQKTVARQTELQNEITELEKTINQMNTRQEALKEELAIQHKLEQELEHLQRDRIEKDKVLSKVQEKLLDSENILKQRKQELNSIINEIDELQGLLEKEPAAETLEANNAKLLKELGRLEEIEKVFKLNKQLQNAESSLATATTRIPEIDKEQTVYEKMSGCLPGVQKIDKLQQLFEENGMELPLDLTLDIGEMNRIGHGITSLPYQIDEVKQLHERLRNAISKIEETLHRQAFPLGQIPKRVTNTFGTIPEMHDMVDQIGRFLIRPETKKLLAMPGHPEQKTLVLQKLANNLSHLYGKLDEVLEMGHAIQQQMQIRQEVKRLFTVIKKGTRSYFMRRLSELNEEKQAFQQRLHTLTEERNSLAVQLAEKNLNEFNMTEAELATGLENVHSGILECEEQLANIKEAVTRLDVTQNQQAVLKVSVQEAEDVLALSQKEKDEMEMQLDHISEQIADKKDRLNPEIKNELKGLTDSIAEGEEELDQLKKEQNKLPIRIELQRQWELLLEEASEYDLDEIRKLYVQHANVIGTTCVASASKAFMEDYPEFDVVIIDEVSKATPPELLLPMLKGKKIILVGDHHQLPPLIGQETMDEFIHTQESNEQQGLRKLLNESLFERLFRTLPKQNKTMLSIQYRMHERIMSTISPFYKEGNYELQCGLPDSDLARDHLLESPLIQREEHLLWIDTPNEHAYFEEKPKGGTSRFNKAELQLIRESLLDLESATELAKAAGRISDNEKKSVGIISFYGEQVKRINHLIDQEIRPKHLHCRTGSVDKFQGMEMDIIILSFVRNHDESSGDIGFAKDYRRLNVALSRSRELLIIIGSSEMFASRTKNEKARDMYQRLYETVQHQGKIRTVKEQQMHG
ncbi:AAA domain-containing protein [Aciduricibacillus chroicocephali]|uniref:AAA domain-containing protein n=1 Tax=Aciduricibacillus chroicocephali TaxID=3054939 RepID=A0ABY9KWF6_9BACI|nr:AAA domain-containing protein [Bacillaceae bacterium 44XB]